MNELILELPLIGNVNIIISNDEIAKFTARQFKNYIKEFNIISCNVKFNSLIKVQNKKIIKNFEDLSKDFLQLGRNYLFDKCKITLSNIDYFINNDTLNITTGLKQKIKWYKKYKKINYSKQHSGFYDYILYPIFSLYTLLDGYYLLHGSLLRLKEKNILLSGIDGVGKSSLCNFLCKEGGEILSDNFVLFNGQNSIPFKIAMRIDPNQETSLNTIFKNNELKEVLPPLLNDDNSKIILDKIYILTIGSNFKINSFNTSIANLILFLNLAPEINIVNQKISPLLYANFKKNKYFKDNLKITCLEIPKGQLKEGVKEILNDY